MGHMQSCYSSRGWLCYRTMSLTQPHGAYGILLLITMLALLQSRVFNTAPWGICNPVTHHEACTAREPYLYHSPMGYMQSCYSSRGWHCYRAVSLTQPHGAYAILLLIMRLALLHSHVFNTAPWGICNPVTHHEAGSATEPCL